MEAREFEATLKDLETRLDRLKALYEMYFQGIERIEPSVARKQVDRAIQVLRKEQPRSTHLRFRFQSLLQRYVTLQTYWGRVTRQIEEGTYTRDLKRMRRRKAKRAEVVRARAERVEEEVAPKVHELDLDADADLSSLLDDPELDAAIARMEAAPTPSHAGSHASPPSKRAVFGKPTEKRRHLSGASPGSPPGPPPVPVKRSAAPPPPPPAKASAARSAGGASPPPPPVAPRRAPTQTGPDDARMHRIYEDYVAARRSNNQPVENVRFESVQRSIEKMLPSLREKHRGKSIDFEVVVREGRVGLKPVTK